MNLKTHCKTAAHNLLNSLLRTLLAMLGIVVGTASVVALVSSGQLAAEQALLQFKGLGVNLMSFNISPLSVNATNLPPVPTEKILNIKNEVAGIEIISPFITNNFSISYKTNSWNSPIIGATGNLNEVINIEMQQGRFIHPLDQSKYFCVIGQNVLKQLKILTPIGQDLRVGNLFFTIIGVVKPWTESSFFQANVNDSIIIPINTIKLLSTNATINDVIMKVEPNASIDALKTNISAYFKKYLPDYTAYFQSAKELIRSMETQQQIFTLLLGLIGGIALFVGGIGVMNIMLAAVTERRYEIGLRLALGAQPIDIQWMFLLEATLLAVIGGAAGVILGIASTYIVALVSNWSFKIFIMPALIGFTVSVLISIFFGFYPAYKASKLNPIEALRGS